MNNDAERSLQTSCIYRILGGGYLLYLAWDLRTSIGKGPLFLIAVVVFGLVGAVMLGHSLLTLARQGYFRNYAVPKAEITEDCEERSDD